jgi:type IV pilus assembly protein PilN
MRLEINLASQPYEDARQFWMRWGTAAGAVGLLTLILLGVDISGWIAARHDHLTMARQRTLIAERDRTRSEAERVLNLPENRTTRDESQFLNQLIVKKAFSWTRVLENLEKVMPARVHVVSISPEVDDDNDLMLKMTVAGDSRDRALELERRMEDSRRFANVNIARANKIDSKTGDTEQVELVAIYIPELLPQAASPPSSTASEAAASTKPKTPPVAKAPTSKGRKR